MTDKIYIIPGHEISLKALCVTVFSDIEFPISRSIESSISCLCTASRLCATRYDIEFSVWGSIELRSTTYIHAELEIKANYMIESVMRTSMRALVKVTSQDATTWR